MRTVRMVDRSFRAGWMASQFVTVVIPGFVGVLIGSHIRGGWQGFAPLLFRNFRRGCTCRCERVGMLLRTYRVLAPKRIVLRPYRVPAPKRIVRVIRIFRPTIGRSLSVTDKAVEGMPKHYQRPYRYHMPGARHARLHGAPHCCS
eukprot:9487410-Pyramimonas_sp.AAC.2